MPPPTRRYPLIAHSSQPHFHEVCFNQISSKLTFSAALSNELVSRLLFILLLHYYIFLDWCWLQNWTASVLSQFQFFGPILDQRRPSLLQDLPFLVGLPITTGLKRPAKRVGSNQYLTKDSVVLKVFILLNPL